MDSWQTELLFDPIAPLLAAEDPAITYFTRRDLLGERLGDVEQVWALQAPQQLIAKQRGDGSWPYAGKIIEVYPPHHYALVETWKSFRVLVEQYEFSRSHPAAGAAAEFLFLCQTEEGDMRGMIGNQYATYYTGAILALLIKAGYADDPRTEKGIRWLLAMRQEDGGWTIPLLTAELDWQEQLRVTSQYAEPVALDRSQPFSHNWTGMALRAFAAHPQYRQSIEARHAATLLASRFFQPDCYRSYQDASYWVRFDYPYWWNNLVAALDTVSAIGLGRDNEQVQQAVRWLITNQEADGLWRCNYARAERENSRSRSKRLWVSLAICRVLKRLAGMN